MAKKKSKKKISVMKVSSVENTLRQMPRYNAYAGGYGAFQNKEKHPNRSQRKAALKKELRNYDSP